MKEPLVLYSTNTWLAYAIAERYYGGVHFAWCSPVYDGTTAVSSVNIPPSSSPAELYRHLLEEARRGERHSAKLEKHREGLKTGIRARWTDGTIDERQAAEIERTIDTAGGADFRPVLYVIPFERVRGTVFEVPVEQRAHPLSVEYRVENLARECFDMLELRI
jgi:hypothetical protein